MESKSIQGERSRGSSQQLKRVFIDGQAGTVGLCIRERLARMAGVDVVEIPGHLRKDRGARLECMQHADVAVLCLPDSVATETVEALAKAGSRLKILDASTAHRVAPGWIYGFPELTLEQQDEIRSATHVTNPGCYATGAIALLKPLIDAGVIPVDFPVTINAVSGYSGGGNALIERMKEGQGPAFKLYGLLLDHKHLPEIQAYTGLQRRPVFVPSVGNYRQGMLVSIPLHLDALPDQPTGHDVLEILRQRYVWTERVSILGGENDVATTEIQPEALNETDNMELHVYSREKQAVLIARLDNLGMGAAGTAVRNIELMLGGPSDSK